MPKNEMPPSKDDKEWITIVNSSDKMPEDREHADLKHGLFPQTPRLQQDIETTEPLPEHRRNDMPSDEELFGDGPDWATIVDNTQTE